jgi:hypothetical protein
MMNPLSNKMENNKTQNETKSFDVSNDVLIAVQRLMELNDDYNKNNAVRRRGGREENLM